MHACAHFVCTLRSHGVLQGFKATKHVPRDVNPIFKSMVMLTEVDDSEMLQFLIKDVGVFEASHLMGVGPKLVASATLKVGVDFNGWLEMEPAKLIAGQGGPVLQLSVRHSSVADPRAAWPSVGNTSMRVEMFEQPAADDLQATRGVPSAPFDLDASRSSSVDVSSLGKSSGEFGSSGVPGSGVPPQTTMGEPEEEAEHVAPSSGVPASSGSGVPASSGVDASSSSSGVCASSSKFYIDPEVFTFSPDKHVLARLFDMQTLQQSDPFPSAPLRNYNIFGAGFDKESNDFPAEYTWEVFPGCWNKAKLDLCVQHFGRFVENRQHRHWCESVLAIHKVLEYAQACRMWPRHDACLNSCAPFMQRDAHVVFIRVVLASCWHVCRSSTLPRIDTRSHGAGTTCCVAVLRCSAQGNYFVARSMSSHTATRHMFAQLLA